jgi:hypothetical protein
MLVLPAHNIDWSVVGVNGGGQDSLKTHQCHTLGTVFYLCQFISVHLQCFIYKIVFKLLIYLNAYSCRHPYSQLSLIGISLRGILL